MNDHAALFQVILLAHTVTMFFIVIAAVRRPRFGYLLLGMVAVCSFIAALNQAVTGEFSVPSLLLSALLVVLMRGRVIVGR